MPMLSSRINIIAANVIWIVNVMENILLSFDFSLPSSNEMNLWLAAVKLPLNKENIATNPPTILYIPKSSTPKVSSTIRLVKILIAIVRKVRKYRNIVFLAILLLFDNEVVGINYNLERMYKKHFVCILTNSIFLKIAFLYNLFVHILHIVFII